MVDVGTTRVDDRATIERLFAPGSKRLEAFDRRGSIVVGDVHPAVAEVAGALTPVPGGVGPLTIAMLLKNTLAAAEMRVGSRQRSDGRGERVECDALQRLTRCGTVSCSGHAVDWLHAEGGPDRRNRDRQEPRAGAIPGTWRAVPRRRRARARRDGGRNRGVAARSPRGSVQDILDRDRRGRSGEAGGRSSSPTTRRGGTSRRSCTPPCTAPSRRGCGRSSCWADRRSRSSTFRCCTRPATPPTSTA